GSASCLDAAEDRHARGRRRTLPAVREIHSAYADWPTGHSEGVHPLETEAAGPRIGPAATAVRRKRKPRSRNLSALLPSADLEDLRATYGTGTLGRRATVLHRDLLG